MSARYCVILVLILVLILVSLTPWARAFPADTVIANGIRIFDFPSEDGFFEVVAGYRAGGRTNLDAAIAGYLSSSASARQLVLGAYASGGQVEFFNEIDRSGFRVRVPDWARPMVIDHIAGYFREIIPEIPNALLESDSQDQEKTFRARVEYEIRLALLGPGPAADDAERLFTESYGTDRAFLGMSGGVPESVIESLSAVPARASARRQQAGLSNLTAERTFRFAPELSTGAVIFATPVLGVHYNAWYSMLMLDSLLQRLIPGSPKTSLQLSLDPYYYRFEIPVPAGQFPEQVEETLLQEIERLRLSRARPEDLEAARNQAREYLGRREAQLWFASQGIPEKREEGLQSIQSFTADDMRGAARDLLIMNRVLATWAPKVKQTAVEVESLSGSTPLAESKPARSSGVEVTPIPLIPFPSHSHTRQPASLPERLPSGVSVITSSAHAVFVAGGALTRLDREPGPDVLAKFQRYRADRILVLAPAASMDRARQLWSGFKGNGGDTDAVNLRGEVTTGDLPAMAVLKTILDRKLIGSGLWSDLKLRINADIGATMEVNHPVVLEWIRNIAQEKPADTELAWAREAALHHLDDILPDLQALTWERDPAGMVQDIETISAGHVQDVARIYFLGN